MPSPVYTRPGVYVIEQLTGAPTSSPSTSPSVGAFTGEHWCGIPNTAVKCTSWADFVKFFGGFNPNPTPVLSNIFLPYAVYMFFLNGGQVCYVNRIDSSSVPGAAASSAFIDSTATPQTTLTLQAGALGKGGNIGSWGNSLYADIYAMNNAPGRFGINIYKGGWGPQFQVETFPDLSMTRTDPRYALSILNSVTQGSYYVVGIDGNDPTTSPSNAPLPVAGAHFTGGTDTGDPSTADKIAAITSGQCAFDYVPGPLTMNLPGESSPTVLDAAIIYAQTRQSTFLAMDSASGLTPASVVAFFQGLSPISSYAALYYPWITAQNPASQNLTNTILMPPGGFVLGQMARTDTTKGVWWAPAGAWTGFSGAVAIERQLSPSDLGLLNQNNVNAIKQRANGQIQIGGARTMQTGYASLFVPVRRFLNYVESALQQSLGTLDFSPNDPLTWAQVVAICDGFLGTLLAQGAFPSSNADEAYFVICDETNNTPTSIAQGVMNVTVGVALTYPAEFIVLTLQQFEGGTVTVTAS